MDATTSEQEESLGFMHPRRVVRALGIVPGMKIAELGSGPGVLVRTYAEAVGPSGRVYAVDVQQDLLRKVSREMTQAGLQNVEIIWANIEDARGTKLADGAVDIVSMSNVLFQCENKRAALKEARRIIKPDGIFALIDWRDSFGGLGPHPTHVVTQREARQLLEDTGFSIVREFVPGAHHYGFLCRVAQNPHRSVPIKS